MVFLDFDDIERYGVDRRFEATSGFVRPVDFVAAVIDLDASQRPAALLGKRTNRLASFPVTDRSIAIFLRLCRGCRHDRKGHGWQDAGLHHRFLSSSDR